MDLTDGAKAVLLEELKQRATVDGAMGKLLLGTFSVSKEAILAFFEKHGRKATIWSGDPVLRNGEQVWEANP